MLEQILIWWNKPLPLDALSLTHLNSTNCALDTAASVLQSWWCLSSNRKSLFFQCVVPCIVSTNMSNMRVGPLVKSAEGFVREALNTVSHSSFTNGCLSHNLQVSHENLPRDHSHTASSYSMTSLLLPSSSRMCWLQYSCQTGSACQPSSPESCPNSRKECTGKRRNSHVSAAAVGSKWLYKISTKISWQDWLTDNNT